MYVEDFKVGDRVQAARDERVGPNYRGLIGTVRTVGSRCLTVDWDDTENPGGQWRPSSLTIIEDEGYVETQALRAELEDLKDKLSDRDSWIKGLNDKLSERGNWIDRLEEDLMVAKSDVGTRNARIEQLTTRIEELITRVNESDSSAERWQNVAEKHLGKMRGLAVENLALSSRVNELTEDIADDDRVNNRSKSYLATRISELISEVKASDDRAATAEHDRDVLSTVLTYVIGAIPEEDKGRVYGYWDAVEELAK